MKSTIKTTDFQIEVCPAPLGYVRLKVFQNLKVFGAKPVLTAVDLMLNQGEIGLLIGALEIAADKAVA